MTTETPPPLNWVYIPRGKRYESKAFDDDGNGYRAVVDCVAGPAFYGSVHVRNNYRDYSAINTARDLESYEAARVWCEAAFRQLQKIATQLRQV